MCKLHLYRLTLAIALASAWVPCALAQKVVPAQSEIAFVTKQMGVPVDGKFRKFDAQITLDPKKPEAGHVSFAIDTASASFGAAETDAEVPKPVWLNVAKFPQATFQSAAIKGLGGGKFEVAGKLTIKGSARDVVVPVAVTQAGANSTASGSFTIKRLEFKVGEAEWADTSLVANDIQVKFKLALTGLAPL
ncbi:MAG: YceI family protein [Burkholderiales bacterium]|nr:YceI family protein [Burkholderiales bacterium]